jgi:hypothetical protein
LHANASLKLLILLEAFAMKWPALLLTVLGLVCACGSTFQGGGDGDGGGGNAGSGNVGRGGGSSGGSSGSSGGNGTGGSGGSAVIGAGGDAVIGVGAAPGGGGETVIGVGGDGTIGAGGGFDGGAGASGTSCDSLIANYLSELDQARDCNPDVQEPECNHDWVMEGPCGCPIAYSGFAENIEKINELKQQMADAGCELANCEAPCIEPIGTCSFDGNERFICQ